MAALIVSVLVNVSQKLASALPSVAVRRSQGGKRAPLRVCLTVKLNSLLVFLARDERLRFQALNFGGERKKKNKKKTRNWNNLTKKGLKISGV